MCTMYVPFKTKTSTFIWVVHTNLLYVHICLRSDSISFQSFFFYLYVLFVLVAVAVVLFDDQILNWFSLSVCYSCISLLRLQCVTLKCFFFFVSNEHINENGIYEVPGPYWDDQTKQICILTFWCIRTIWDFRSNPFVK